MSEHAPNPQVDESVVLHQPPGEPLVLEQRARYPLPKHHPEWDWKPGMSLWTEDLNPQQIQQRDAYLREIAKNGGRPRKADVLADEREWETFHGLLEIQCTQAECASVLRCTPEALANRVTEVTGLGYKEYAKRIKPRGVVAIKRKQFQLALGDDKTPPDKDMLKFLGKNYAKQAERVDHLVALEEEAAAAITAAANPLLTIMERIAQIAERQAQGKLNAAERGEVLAPATARQLTGGIEVPNPDDAGEDTA